MKGSAAPVAVQTEMDVADPAELAREREREVEDQQELLQRFFKACREVVREWGGYDKVAAELDEIWAPIGRSVAGSTLKVTLAAGNERNYFRFEWAIWFARNDEDCADLLAEIIGKGKPKKAPQDELRDLHAELRTRYPKDADKIIRKAATS